MTSLHYNAERLRTAARKAGISQTELARRVGRKRITVHRALNGGQVGFETLHALCRELELDVRLVVHPTA